VLEKDNNIKSHNRRRKKEQKKERRNYKKNNTYEIENPKVQPKQRPDVIEVIKPFNPTE